MAVNHKHTRYQYHAPDWFLLRDLVAGSRAVKAAGSKYLPIPGGMDSDEYNAYKNRAVVYGALGRTEQGLRGAIFRKELTHEGYHDEEHLKDVTLQGESLQSVARTVIDEVLEVGRVGVLVDTKENAERPWMALYTAENIVNWRTERDAKGKEIITLLVLREDRDKIDPDDSFKTIRIERYRVLQTVDGFYQYTIWEADDTTKKDSFKIVEGPIMPTRNGKKMDFVPFVIINSSGLTLKINKPPLLDLAEVNISHYVTSADLEHGAHYTALPMAYFAGFSTDTKIKMGSSNVMVSDSSDAKAGYLEYTGQGLNSLQEIKQDKQRLMAVLGARLLEEQTKSSEAYDSRRLRLSGETGTLADIVDIASEGLTKALNYMEWWQTKPEKAVVKLNNDFLDQSLDPQTLSALFAALQSGEISFDTWFYNLKRGELIPPDVDAEIELDLIDARPPGVPEPSDTPPKTTDDE